MTTARRPRLLVWTLAALLWLLAADARALCTVTCTCTVSTTNLLFGGINPMSAANTDSTGTVSVTCGGIAGLSIPVTVDIAKGSGSFASRTMFYGSYPLSYNLYSDSNRTSVFGDGTGSTTHGTGTVGLAALGTGPPVVFTVYGRVFGAQATAVPGAYADSLAITVTYY